MLAGEGGIQTGPRAVLQDTANLGGGRGSHAPMLAGKNTLAMGGQRARLRVTARPSLSAVLVIVT